MISTLRPYLLLSLFDLCLLEFMQLKTARSQCSKTTQTWGRNENQYNIDMEQGILIVGIMDVAYLQINFMTK